MIKRLKIRGLFLLCLATGILMISMAVTEPDFSMGARIFAIFFGLLFLFFGFLYLSEKKPVLLEGKQQRKHLKDRNNIFSFYETVEDKNEQEAFLSNFRKSFAEFFMTNGVPENSAFQFNSTQLFWNITALKKKRLESRGIKEEFYSERKDYTGLDNVKTNSYFDGKYFVTQFSESIAAKMLYMKNEKPIYCRIDRQVAEYVMTDIKEQESEKGKTVICPGCGAKTTRENLIDGCDYCGTKFKVEDLNKKISAFRFRKDYIIEYEKYKMNRTHYNERVFTFLFIIFLIIALIIYTFMGLGELAEMGGNIVNGITSAILASALFAGGMAFLGLCCFWIIVFPILQVKASAKFVGKRYLNKLKERERKDDVSESKIRNYDPLFSINSFYSSIENKLAVIHFADNKETIAAFFDGDSESIGEKLLGKYSDVFNMDVSDICIEDFNVSNGLQSVKVNVTLDLLRDGAEKIQAQKETLTLELVRNESVKTQEICEPVVFRCKGCGASIALENGKKCPYCGQSIDFKAFDWAIREYILSLELPQKTKRMRFQ